MDQIGDIKSIAKAARLGYWRWRRGEPPYREFSLWAELLDYDSENFGNQEELWLSLIEPDDLLKSGDAWNDLLSGKSQHYSVEYRVTARDGTFRWCESRAVIINRDDHGIPIEVMGTMIDVHNAKVQADEISRLNRELEERNSALLYELELRTAVEQSLEESRSRYESFVELCPDGVFVSRNGAVVLINEHLAQMLGYQDRREILGRSVIDILDPTELHHFQSVSAAAMQGRWDQLEQFLVRRKDGSSFWVEAIGKPFPIVEGVESIIIARDITERLESERILREQKARWQFALEGSEQGVWEWFPQEKRGFRSSTWKTILGFDGDEPMDPGPDDFWQRLHPDDRERIFTSYDHLSSGLSPAHVAEFRMQCKDGSYKWIQSRWKVMQRDAEGNPIHLVGTHVDITPQIKVQEEIQMLNQVLADRAADLERKNKELESFSYSVSHDLRAPLRSIDFSAATLLEDGTDDLTGDQKDELLRIRTSTKRMSSLIDGLLGLSRVSKTAFERKQVNVSEIAEHVLNRIKLDPNHENLQIEIQQNLIVSGDQRLIEVAFTNVIENAVKYSQDKPLPLVRMTGTTSENTIRISISDNGIGFDPSNNERIFKPFERLQNTQTFEGHGVGLATVQRIMERHNGTSSAEGRLGEGATITLEFPVVET